MRKLYIGRQSAGFIRRGHPWVRQDRFTRGLADLQSGEPVCLVDEQGRGIASALIDKGHPQICARVYHRQAGKAFDPERALGRALERRQALLQDPSTDCYRLVHGEADFLPGLRIELLGSYLLVLLFSEAMRPYAQDLAQRCAQLCQIPAHRVVLREHYEDQRRRPSQAQMLDARPLDPQASCQAHELGVPLSVQPCAGLASGIYVDQRGTRRWLRERCQGWQVLNLFAYSGLFSTSLLQAGAAQALSLDCSAPALQMAQENARLAGVAEKHQVQQEDCLSFARSCQQRYDLIICDPPTAARGGRGWYSQRDYPVLLQALRRLLAPQGLLVAVSNSLGRPFPLRASLEGMGMHCLREEDGPCLDPDIPLLSGFPEGRPFRLVLAHEAAGGPR